MAETTTETMPRKKPNVLWWIGGIFLLLFLWFLYQLFGPSPAIVVSKQTTYVTQPLRSDGLPDYERYVLEMSREGVTPENNAAVLLMQALWPGDLQPQHYAAVVKELGLEQTPSKLDALVPITGGETQARVVEWLKQTMAAPQVVAQTGNGDAEAADEINAPVGGTVASSTPQNVDWELLADAWVEQAKTRAWTSAEIPPLAKWLEENQSPLDLILAATARPRCYFPSPSLLDSASAPGGLMGTLLTMIQSAREAARVLAARSMWHLGEGRFEEAWQHALAIHRLARLIAQGYTLVDQLVGIAVDGMACEVDMTLLNDPNVPPAVARQMLAELNALPPMSNVVNSVQQGERLFGLDAIMRARGQGISVLMSEFQKMNRIETVMSRLSIDWNQVLMDMNGWYDKFAAAAALETREMRQQAFTRLLGEFQQATAELTSPGSWISSALNRRARSKLMGNFIAGMLLPAFGGASDAADRDVSRLDLSRVAVALKIYQVEHDGYPASLNELTPTILDKVPTDIYSGRPLIYRRDANGQGYVLYSVYQNGIDDGGTDFLGKIVKGEWIEGEGDYSSGTSDHVIRLPLRPLVRPHAKADVQQ